MDDEPPDDFVSFVYVHLADLLREAARLTGGPQHADEVYPEALADVAGHWRRLRLRRRLTHRDVSGEFLSRRLAKRAAQWRDEQIYEVEVHLLLAPVHHYESESIALRKATLLPGTERRQLRPVAEASIAWTHAWRRAYWRRIARVVAASAVLFIAAVQAVPVLPD